MFWICCWDFVSDCIKVYRYSCYSVCGQTYVAVTGLITKHMYAAMSYHILTVDLYFWACNLVPLELTSLSPTHTHTHTSSTPCVIVLSNYYSSLGSHYHSSFYHTSLSLSLTCHARWMCYLLLLDNTVFLPSHINCDLYIIHPSL